MRILIVEDERRLAENISRSLRESACYAVDIAEDGTQGLYLAQSISYDLVVLDLMLPKLEGYSLLVRLRKRGHTTPVLVLTAKEEKESVVRLLNAGTDDYVSKPFDLGEFLARAKALVRRGTAQRAPVISVGDLRLDTVGRVVKRGASDWSWRFARRRNAGGLAGGGGINLNVFFICFWLLYCALKWSLNCFLATAWIETAGGMRGCTFPPIPQGSR